MISLLGSHLVPRYEHKNVSFKDVIKVFAIYNELWKNYSGFPGPDRPSDSDFWDMRKPAMQSGGTIGEGAATLTFTFRNSTEEAATKWVKEFIGAYKLPYTSVETRPSRDLRGLITYEPGEEVPTYVRVIIEFKENQE